MIKVSKSSATLPLQPRAAPKPLLKDPAVMKNYPKFYVDILNPSSPPPPPRRDSAVDPGRVTSVTKRPESAPSQLSPRA
jgi:hypothetical protein